MRIVVKFPQPIKCGFRGGNYSGTATGLTIDAREDVIYLTPHKKSGEESGSCWFAIPRDPETLNRLIHLLDPEKLQAAMFVARVSEGAA